jgi:hypothetical protein
MVTMVRPSLTSRRSRGQRGQAVTELALCLLLLIAFTTAVMQALHFELDVFNKSELLRYRALHRARQNQDTTDPETVTDETVQGKDLSDLTFFKVPLQDVDLSQHWGPKHLVIRHGTQYWDPTPIHGEGAFFLALGIDHYEDSSGLVGQAFEFLANAANSIPM